MKKIIIIALICLSGITSRLFIFNSEHPDGDDFFELKNMQKLKPVDVLKRTSMYGDHTSFPGEFIVHYLPMKAIGMFDKSFDLTYEDGGVSLTKLQCWILAIPKIIMSLFGFYLFWLLCGAFINTTLGFIVAFLMFSLNTTLIYYSFTMRPYGILPELAILNIFLAIRCRTDAKFGIIHGAVIFFTCIYHAYGPMIAMLPMLFFHPKRHPAIIPMIFLGVLAWNYYASHNTFGMTPNHIQSVVDPFQFITKENFLNGIMDSLFSGSTLTVVALLFVCLGAMSADRHEIMFLTVMVLIPMALIILVDIKTSYWILPRQYSWTIPALALWCGMMADKCSISDLTKTK